MNKILGILISFFGVVQLFYSGGDLTFDGQFKGRLAILCAAMSYSIGGAFGKRFKGIPNIEVSAMTLGFCSLFLLPITLVTGIGSPISELSFPTVAAMLTLALLCTGIAYLLYFSILEETDATNALLVTIMVPPVAIILGTVTLNETLNSSQILSMFSIFLGLLVLDGRLFKFKALNKKRGPL